MLPNAHSGGERMLSPSSLLRRRSILLAAAVSMQCLVNASTGFAQETAVSQIAPDVPGTSAPAQALSEAQMEQLMQRKYRIRQILAAKADASAPVAPPDYQPARPAKRRRWIFRPNTRGRLPP